MLKNFMITVYLLAFKIIYNIFNFLPSSKKVTFIVSFGDNSNFIYEEMMRQKIENKIIVLYKGEYKSKLGLFSNNKTIHFENRNIMDTIRSIFHIATSNKIIIDNYFAFLSVVKFKNSVECIQVWHAAGALKKFGLMDHSVQYRGKKDLSRFRKVYENFHKVVVGSEEMANIFIDSFNISESNILRTGIPRTDLFFDEQRKSRIRKKLTHELNLSANKKVILYAPTFRDNELQTFEVKLDLKLMHEELKEDYILLIRLHPAIRVKDNIESLYPGFIINVSHDYDVNELLLITDILITDYSSIPFEYALLEKPMIFFSYDIESYRRERGLIDDYEKVIPSPIVQNTSDIITSIRSNQYQIDSIKGFRKTWNQYSKGYSSKNLVNYLFKNG